MAQAAIAGAQFGSAAGGFEACDPSSTRSHRHDWASSSLRSRIAVLRAARELLAIRAESIAEAISPELDRTPADTLVAEVLPLLAAMRFLEREAEALLRPRRVGVDGRPLWLGRVTSIVERVALGRILVIGPGNYPLLLPGVQVIQALVAGNEVIWKPGRGGYQVATAIAVLLLEAGLPAGALEVTDESTDAAYAAIDSGIDKIFFTGSGAAGRQILGHAAEQLVPCVMELSGADAAIVLPSAHIADVVAALAFALRLNGSATCMAPRRLLLVKTTPERRLALLEALWKAVVTIGPVRVRQEPLRLATELLDEARAEGATVLGGQVTNNGTFEPALILDGKPTMRVAQSDVFAPLLTVIDVEDLDGIVEAQAQCPLALTASIFGDEHEAQAVAARLRVGHVSINDVIVPTADPRVPFGGRDESGFGSTRGAEGLLEMTTPRVIAIRRGRGRRRYERTGPAHTAMFSGLAALLYGRGVARLRGGIDVMSAAARISAADKVTEAGEV